MVTKEFHLGSVGPAERQAKAVLSYDDVTLEWLTIKVTNTHGRTITGKMCKFNETTQQNDVLGTVTLSASETEKIINLTPQTYYWVRDDSLLATDGIDFDWPPGFSFEFKGPQ